MLKCGELMKMIPVIPKNITENGARKNSIYSSTGYEI